MEQEDNRHLDFVGGTFCPFRKQFSWSAYPDMLETIITLLKGPGNTQQKANELTDIVVTFCDDPSDVGRSDWFWERVVDIACQAPRNHHWHQVLARCVGNLSRRDEYVCLEAAKNDDSYEVWKDLIGLHMEINDMWHTEPGPYACRPEVDPRVAKNIVSFLATINNREGTWFGGSIRMLARALEHKLRHMHDDLGDLDDLDDPDEDYPDGSEQDEQDKPGKRYKEIVRELLQETHEKPQSQIAAAAEWLIVSGDRTLEAMCTITDEEFEIGPLAPEDLTDAFCFERWVFWRMRLNEVRREFPPESLASAQIGEALDSMAAAERRRFGDTRQPAPPVPESAP